MGIEVSTQAYMQAKINILEDDVRSKNDKIAMLEAYVQQLTAESDPVTEVDDEGN